MALVVRDARLEDRAAACELLRASASAFYARFAGSDDVARALLEELWEVPGHTASPEICRVAELDGEIAGLCAAFPVREGDERARSFVALALRELPLRRRPRAWRTVRAAGGLVPAPPPDAWYVDALAVAAAARRRGVARALLEDAAERGREAGLSWLALETELENAPARALYRAAGLSEGRQVRPGTARQRRAVGVSGFVALRAPLVRDAPARERRAPDQRWR
jgi:ribosomal protein S18 acetylase RimI-like enzyme